MKRNRRIGPALAGVVFISSGLAPAATLVNGGDWSNPFNWSPANVPDTPGESAAVNGGDVTLDGSFGIGTLSLTSGAVYGPGSLTTGSMNWSGGQVRGAATITVSGAATLTVPASSDLYVDAGTLNFQGNTTQSGVPGGDYPHPLYLDNNATVNNSGAYSITDDTGLFKGFLNNTGTFAKTGGTGTSQIAAATVNTGTLAAQSGTLEVFTRDGATSSGTLSAAAGATLKLSVLGTHTLAATTAVTGTGTLKIAGFFGTLDVGGARNIAGTLELGGVVTVNVNGATSLAKLRLTEEGTLGGSGAINAATLDWTSGTLTGPAAVTVTGPATLSTLGGGTLTLSRTLTLQGSTTQTGRDDYGLELRSGATLNNGGTYAINDNTRVYDNSAATAAFNNSGTLTKTSGAGGARVEAVASTGVVSVTSGTLSVALRGGASGTGSFIAGPGATLELIDPNAAHALTSSATLGGGGTLRALGNLNVAGTVRADGTKLDVSAGSAVHVTGVVADGAGPTGTAGLVKSGGGTLTLSGTNTYRGALFLTAGTLVVADAALDNLLNGPGGVTFGETGGTLVLSYENVASPTATVKSLLAADYGSDFALGQFRLATPPANHTIGYADDPAAHRLTLRVTLPGDADFDGDVDFNDFLVLQANFSQTGTTFTQADFNYDSKTDFNDFLLLQASFGQSVGFGVAAPPVSAAEYARIIAITSAGAVPEPAALALVALAATGLRRRPIRRAPDNAKFRATS